MLALAMVLGCTLAPAITSHAQINDGCVREENPGADAGKDTRCCPVCYHAMFNCQCGKNNDGGSSDTGSSDSGSSDSGSESSGSGTVSEDIGYTEGRDFNSGSDDGTRYGSGNGSGSDNGSGSGSSVSYDDAASAGYDSGSYDTGSAEGTGSAETAEAPAANGSGVARKGSYVTVPGYETWRQAANAAEGTFRVYHCGVEQYGFQLKDATGSAVSYKGCGILKDADGSYWLNVVTADSTDTTGWTVGTVKGTVNYLAKLGVSGVMLDGKVAVTAAK